MNQLTIKLKFAALFIILFSIGAGCKEAAQDPPYEPPTGTGEVNPNKPNANDLITHQIVFGDPEKQSSIWEIIDSGEEGFYFRGYYNNRYALGKLDPNGQEIWTVRSRYSVRDLIRIPGLSGGLSNSLLCVGGLDSDFEGGSDIGCVSLFNSAGSLINELEFSNDEAAVWFSALAVSRETDSLYHLVAAGGVEISGDYFPYIARFTVANDSTMSKTGEKIFSDLPTKFFRNIQFKLGQSPPSCYLQGDVFTAGTGYEDQVVYQMSEILDISWSQDIVAQADFKSWTSNGRGFAYSSNKLFMASTTDIDKEVDTPSGGYWDAGVIAGLSTEGSVDYIKSIVLSQYSDKFSSCCLSEGVLFVSGECSSFLKTESRNVFSNALLLKIDPETGGVISTLGFGDENYYSRFNHVLVKGTQAIAVGYTNYEVKDGPFQGWFVIADVSGASIVPDQSIPVMNHTRDRDAENILNDLEGTGFSDRN
jgi:hypothetical protein